MITVKEKQIAIAGLLMIGAGAIAYSYSGTNKPKINIGIGELEPKKLKKVANAAMITGVAAIVYVMIQKDKY